MFNSIIELIIHLGLKKISARVDENCIFHAIWIRKLWMNETRKGKESSIVKQDDLLLTVIKTDVNLSRLPLFAVTRQGLKTKLEREWAFVETRGNERVELIWRVMAIPRYGYPSPFDKKVHRAVEYLLTQNGFPVPEYLEFSFCEIEYILGLPHSGKIYNDIRNALESIATVSIQSEGTFCYLENGTRQFIYKTFHLYDQVVLAGQRLPCGMIADRNRIDFNKYYLQSLNSGYIKPLDFPYWNSLRSDIARRLYEYLSFISFATKCGPFSIEYHKLCNQLPSTPQRYLSLAQRCLKTAHQELIKTGFLKKVVWRKSKTDPKKWILIYHFGMRAKSELKRGFKDDTYRPAILAVETADIEEIEELIESEYEVIEKKAKSKRKQAKEEETLSPIAQELFNRGITKSVAIDFAESFPEEHIKEKIEMHDYKKETGEIIQNAAGWLREAIVRDYQLSEEQLKKQAQLEKKQAQQKEQRTLEEKAKEIQEQRIKEALKDFPSDEQWVRERVAERVKMREMTIEAIGGEHFSSEEISAMYDDFEAQIPKTDEEKRGWLISSSNKYALSTIISELRQEQQKSQQVESRKSGKIGEESKDTANEQVLANSIEDVLGEVARQRAEFEVEQKESEED